MASGTASFHIAVIVSRLLPGKHGQPCTGEETNSCRTGSTCEIEQLQCGGPEQVYIVSPEYDGAGPFGSGVGYASLTDITDFGGAVPETDVDLLLSLHSQLFEQ